MNDTSSAPPKQTQSRWVGPLIVTLGAISIGITPIVVRDALLLGSDGLGIQGLAFWRFLLATPMVFVLVLLVNRRLPTRPNRFVFLAGACFGCQIALWHAALTITTVANATFIVNLGSIGLGLAAFIFLKEVLSRNWGFAAMMALIGAALLTQGGGEEGKGALQGDVLAMIAALFATGYFLCVKIARREIDGLDVLFWATATEAVVAGIVTFSVGESFLPKTGAGWYAPLLMVLVAQGGQGLIIIGFGRTPASIAGLLVVLQPVVAAGLSWHLFDEPLLALQMLGGGLILGGLILSQMGGKPNKVS